MNRTEIIEQCQGCQRIDDSNFCMAYLQPDKKWIHGRICNMATHITEVSQESVKKRIGQQKQKKKTRKQ